MHFEVLSIVGCPNGYEAVRRLTAALAVGGDGAAVEHRVVRTAAEAASTAFAGSPTITLDGEDLFPSAGRVDELACRIYPGVVGVPSTSEIRAAIDNHGL